MDELTMTAETILKAFEQPDEIREFPLTLMVEAGSAEEARRIIPGQRELDRIDKSTNLLQQLRSLNLGAVRDYTSVSGELWPFICNVNSISHR